jgi:hypothetical protein
MISEQETTQESAMMGSQSMTILQGEGEGEEKEGLSRSLIQAPKERPSSTLAGEVASSGAWVHFGVRDWEFFCTYYYYYDESIFCSI